MINLTHKYDLKKLIYKTNKYAEELSMDNINIMEICGTHTNSIGKYGIKSVISNKINLLSGPGCPVCVTHKFYIDAAIDLAKRGVIIATFGDLLRVNGSFENLLHERGKGKDIRIVYSVYDVINIAKENKDNKVVFLGVGFETTAPLIAYVINETKKKNINNLYFLTSIKIMPPILEKILNKNKRIHGIICPGNVAVIRGANSFRFIYDIYKIPAVICGFEAKDILGGIYFLISEMRKQKNKEQNIGFYNLYKTCVSSFGNNIAKKVIKDVFKLDSVTWRGIGKIEKSALVLKDEYSKYDAKKVFNLYKYFKTEHVLEDNKCKCSKVLLGDISPNECSFFGKVCTPKNPYGPCMVSSEGACAAFYKYK